jgi:hypothetical protein
MTSGTDWLEQAQRLFDALRAPAPAGGPSDPTADGAHASDCRWCPVCQAAAVVRGERPEVTEALADILTTTATALRTFAEAAQASAPDATDAAEPDDAGAAPPAVQRIEIA